MFYHGINRRYLPEHYPLLSPRRTVSRKDQQQLSDRQHLLKRFGLEPIHLLEAGEGYGDEQCIKACLHFGDTVFAFSRLPDPLWQLSVHEVGIPVLDLRTCQKIYVVYRDVEHVQSFFPGIPIHFFSKN